MDEKKCGDEKYVVIDNYSIAIGDEKEYLKKRELCALAVEEYFLKFCRTVRRDFAKSEDGEAVVGLNENNEIMALFHLDPENVMQFAESLRENKIVEFLEKIQC